MEIFEDSNILPVLSLCSLLFIGFSPVVHVLIIPSVSVSIAVCRSFLQATDLWKWVHAERSSYATLLSW